MFDEKSRHVGQLLLLLDMLLATLAFLLSFWVRRSLFDAATQFETHLVLLVLILPVLGFLLRHFGAYRGLRVVSIPDYAWTVIRAIAITIGVLAAVLFALKVHDVSRMFLLLFSGLGVFTLVTARTVLVGWYFHASKEKAENFLKVLIIGTGERAKHLAGLLREPAEWGIDIIGYLDLESRCNGTTLLGAPVLGTVDDIGEVLRDRVVDEVILAVPRRMIKDLQKIADVCQEEGVRLRLMADVFDLQVMRMRLVDLKGVPLLTLDPVAHDDMKLLVKRLFDLTASIVMLIPAGPIMALIALAIKLDSPGPVFFMQERVGLHKRTFRMYKFRSMYEDAECRQEEVEHLNEARGPIFKIADDPRITRVGRFLRRTSLDELPQLFNVIRGHMSLVGPRPMSLRDVGLFDKGIQRKRFSVRPGITCLWQISGRSNLPFSKWLELDLAYIENWSLTLDLKILLKTIPAVLRGSGAT